MISIKQAEKVIRLYIHSTMPHLPAGILSSTGNNPSYKCTKHGTPPICICCRKYKESRLHCKRFYDSLELGEQKVTCPFGINVFYLKTDKVAIPIDFFIQTGFTALDSDNDIEKNLSRKPKRAIRNAKRKMSNYEFHFDPDKDTFGLLNRISETLFAGRVAASMRALTHQFLTPVQAVMGDLQVIRHKHNSDDHSCDEKILQLMQGNIGEINSTAKQIQVLLSEGLEPTPNHIRKITVHKMIYDICHRLESIAERKKFDFRVDRNKGITVVEAVPHQIDIVFRCLLENAAKYSFNGKSSDKRKITVRFKDTKLDESPALQVLIQNYGCLISQEEIEEGRIFELGYRGEFSGNKGRQGTGTGLYLVDRIVGAHYGEIEVISKSDGNPDDHQAVNTFTVTWPRYFS